MTKKELKEKYDIELIGKEMWVWDDDKLDTRFKLVLYKDNIETYPYKSLSGSYANASETNPNYKEPKVGDMGYFWNDDEVSYAYGKLEGIDNLDPFPYLCEGFSWHQHFSTEKQPWMK
jgi:hypothetical protein